ncbi:MAG: LysR family transcriptional regulator [Myxococcota bacterium]
MAVVCHGDDGRVEVDPAPPWCAENTTPALAATMPLADARRAMLNWEDYRLFLAVVRAGSIRAAARDLGLDHSRISRRLSRFEDEAGAKLLHRTPRGLRATEPGEQVIAAAEHMERHALASARRLQDKQPDAEGWVRLSANVTLGLKALGPMLVEFSRLHPRIELELQLSQSLADLERNDADLALRVALTPPEDTIARRLCGFAVAIYASSDAPSHWLGWDPAGPYDAFIKETECVDLPVRHRFGNDLMVTEAVAHGLGAAVLPCILGDSTPGIRRLDSPHNVASVFLLRHPDHRDTPRVRAVVDFLVGAFEDVADLAEGRRPRLHPTNGA